MNEIDLKIIIFQSFIGAISNNMRAIAYDYTEDMISIYGYLYDNPKEIDYEIVDIAITEIMSSCPKFKRQNIELIKYVEPIGKLNSYKGWVFVRYEG